VRYYSEKKKPRSEHDLYGMDTRKCQDTLPKPFSGKPVATYVYALHRKNQALWKATYVDTFLNPN
jgi:hypothetical protein